MNKLNFLSYNANGLGLSKKRIKEFEYLNKKNLLQWYYFFAGNTLLRR